MHVVHPNTLVANSKCRFIYLVTVKGDCIVSTLRMVVHNYSLNVLFKLCHTIFDYLVILGCSDMIADCIECKDTDSDGTADKCTKCNPGYLPEADTCVGE